MVDEIAEGVYLMENYQIEKFFYTRTKNVVPADTGPELFLYAALIIETNQPLGSVERNKVDHVASELLECPLHNASALYKELPNLTVMYEVSTKTFDWLKVAIERDRQAFFLFEPSNS